MGAMPHTRVNTAAIRVEPADDHVIEPDERGEHAHRGDEPKRRVPSDGKSKANDVGFARAPIAVKNRGGARRVYVARTLNVGWDHGCPLLTSAWLLNVNDFLTCFANDLINAAAQARASLA